jgi:stearoyl-CoA desaturase (delta-9 desaturase)
MRDPSTLLPAPPEEGRPSAPTTTLGERPSLQDRAAKPGRGSLRLGIPFVLVHLGCLGALFVGWSPIIPAVFVVSYVPRAFGITVFFHRGLAHRAFRAPRWVWALGAFFATAAAQRGPLWWVAHHRRHHRYTDRLGDPHSPVVDGMLRSHVLWIFEPDNQKTDLKEVADLNERWELRMLDRWHYAVSGSLLLCAFGVGTLLGRVLPSLHTSGWQFVVWGFCLPTVVLYHSTFAVNSIAHRFGRRRFATKDASRNNWLVSVFTLGEGWHNNHHRYPVSARQGFGRFELDPSWWLVRAMAAFGAASDLRPVPRQVLDEGGLRSP